MIFVFSCVVWFVVAASAGAVAKVHVISFGKWSTVAWFAGTGAENEKPLTLKVRPLMVDGRVKEFFLGAPHEVTDRLFVVRRAFRVNDSLPDDSAPRWQWQRGGWLLVDRITGRVSPINLPDFDAYFSPASWYRDYVAYCGVSDDGRKTYAIVAQLSRRKPVMKKPLSNDVPTDHGPGDNAVPDSACAAPVWQRAPARVSFAVEGSMKQTFAIRGHIVDVVNDAEDEEDEGTK
ncbi:MAG TPA: hypothetical protein VMH04_23620 [Candidatus Solibacter sp.]|nr:hypothetical protein [Candidatus Solibacter sp.]